MAIRLPLVLGADGLPQQLQSGDTISAPTNAPSLRSVTNSEGAVAVVIGMPVYMFASGGVKRAQANAKATSQVAGLIYDVTIAAAGTGNLCTSGVLVATTGQWDAVAGTTGGLIFNTLYFLDPAAIGKITATVPTAVGQTVTLIGRALSSTELELNIYTPILL